MNLNKVFLVGRLTKDPEVKTTPTGISVASFGLATNRVWVDQAGQKQEQVEFHDIVVWRKLADIAAQYLKKGQLLLVEGRLQTRNWVGQDGIKRYRTEIIADNFQMGPKSSNLQQSRSNYKSGANSQISQQQPEQIPTIQIENEPLVSEVSENTGSVQNQNGDDSEVVPF